MTIGQLLLATGVLAAGSGYVAGKASDGPLWVMKDGAEASDCPCDSRRSPRVVIEHHHGGHHDHVRVDHDHDWRARIERRLGSVTAHLGHLSKHFVDAEDACESGERAFLGIEVRDHEGGERRISVVETDDHVIERKIRQPPGPVVVDVFASSGAAAAGIQSGDRIVSVDGHRIRSSRGLLMHLRRRCPGSTVPMKVERDGEILGLEVVTAARGDFDG